MALLQQSEGDVGYFVRVDSPSVEDMLAVLFAADQGLHDAYQHLTNRWLGVDRLVSQTLSLFSSIVVPAGESVVYSPFVAALQSYAHRVTHPVRHYKPHQCMAQFLRVWLLATVEACRLRVIDGQTHAIWNIAHEHGLSDWLKNRCRLSVEPDPIPPKHFADLLYAKVVPHNIQYAMKRFCHEKTMMAGWWGQIAVDANRTGVNPCFI